MTDISQVQIHQDRARAGRAHTRKYPATVTHALFKLPPDPIPHPEGGWLPEWLANEIRTSPGPRFRTNAAWTLCPRCQAIILTGLDDPCVAAEASVDPSPLTPVGELICALEHRPTYLLALAGSSGRIIARNAWQHPAGTRGKHPVVPAHNCAHRFPGSLIPAAPERTTHDRPPF